MTTNELPVKIICSKYPEVNKTAAMQVILNATEAAFGKHCPQCGNEGHIAENGQGDDIYLECEHGWSGNKIVIEVDEVQTALSGKRR
jgi:ssDNA-binding Zn-finger/Zn-ribbon topoisomerase 1